MVLRRALGLAILLTARIDTCLCRHHRVYRHEHDTRESRASRAWPLAAGC